MTTVTELLSLLNLVCDAKQTPTPSNVVNLKNALNLNEKRILDLLEDKPQNEQHRTTLKSGKIIINGTECRLNEHFIKEAMFISHHLNLDELESARLLREGIPQASALDSTPLEAAVYLYHSEREYVLAILNVILDILKDRSTDQNVQSLLSNFLTDMMQEKLTNGNSFGGKLFKSINDLSVMISTIKKFGMLESGKNVAKELEEERQKKANGALGISQLPQAPNDNSQEPTQFSASITKLRLDKLTEERISLVQILYHIVSLYWISEDDMLAILCKAQSINLSDNIAAYLLTTLLSALSSDNTRVGTDWSTNDTFLKKMHSQVTTEPWKVESLKAATSIQWALFINNVAKSRPAVENALNFNKENRIKLVESSIALNAFGFMNNYLLYFKQTTNTEQEEKKTINDVQEDDSQMALDGLLVDVNDYEKFNIEINKDFQPVVVHELEMLTEHFILDMSDILSGLKTKLSEEKLTGTEDSTTGEKITNAFTKLLFLLASIYRDRQDAGLKFWENGSRLQPFLSDLINLNVHQAYPAIFDFFGAISTGLKSASNCYKKLKIGTDEKELGRSSLFSWGRLFGALQLFNKEFANRSTSEQAPIFPPEEEASMIKFLNLCQQVVQYCGIARTEMWTNVSFRAHENIVQMITNPTSKRFRAALYDLLSGFTSNWGGGVNDVARPIAMSIWQTLEHSDLFISRKLSAHKTPEPVTTTPASGTFIQNTLFGTNNIIQVPQAIKQPVPTQSKQLYSPEQPAEFLREFEEEKHIKIYTETNAVLNMIASLIHTPSKRDKLVQGFAYYEPSIPTLLGHDMNRTPGAAPYISLVVDNIFLKLKNLQYIYPETRWQLADACLAIIENSIMAFNLEVFCDYIRHTIATPATVNNTPEALIINNKLSDTTVATSIQKGLLNLITQPGYDVLIRILSDDSLIQEIFKIVEKGKNAVTTSKDDKMNHFKNSMTRCLRILNKVFVVQNDFVNIFVPQLKDAAVKLDVASLKLDEHTFPAPPPEFFSLGSLMLMNKKVIVETALLVNCDAHEDICALSASILCSLSSPTDYDSKGTQLPNHVTSPVGGIGSKLAGVLLSSPEASSIIFGFSERLEVENIRMTTYDDYEYDMNVIPFWLAEQTLSNIYRFDDYNNGDHYSSSIRLIILDMLLKNLDQNVESPNVTEFLLGYDVKELENSTIQKKSIPIDAQHKSQLACFTSIVNLIRSNTENDHLLPSEQGKLFGQVNPLLASKCYELLFKLCARKSISTATLHYLRDGWGDFFINQFKTITQRLENSLSVAEPNFRGVLISADQHEITTDFFSLVGALDQRAWLLKLIALELRKTAFIPQQQSNVYSLLKLLLGLDNDTKDDSPEELARMMQQMNIRLESDYQQPLWNMLEILNSLEFKWIDGLDSQEDIPLNYFAQFRADTYLTKKNGCSLYDIRTIYKMLRQYSYSDMKLVNLEIEERASMDRELGDILRRLMADNRHRVIANSRLQCLQAWKNVIELTVCDCFDLIDFDSREKIIYSLLSTILPKLESESDLHVDILKGLSEVVLILLTRLKKDKMTRGISQNIRGEDAADCGMPGEMLCGLFTSINNAILGEKSVIEVRCSLYPALTSLLQYITPKNDDIQSKIVQMIQDGGIEKLLNAVCRDAEHGPEKYKASAYMALKALYVLVGQSNGPTIHNYLFKVNFIQYGLDMIKQQDELLTEIIEKRDASLEPLYTYQAKISFLTQISLDEDGASLLLSNYIMEILGGLKFVNFAITLNSSRVNANYQLERHTKLLKPMLELFSNLMINGSRKYDFASKFKRWASNQTIIVNILKDEYPFMNLSTLCVLQLTTGFMYQLSCSPSYFKDLEYSRLSQLDDLMLKLMSKYFVIKDWTQNLIPTTCEEIFWSKQTSNGTINERPAKVLELKADKCINNVRNNLLAYAESFTFRSNQSESLNFKPIFANILGSLHEDTSILSRVVSTRPTLTTLTIYLSMAGKKIKKIISEYDALCSQTSLQYEESVEIAKKAISKNLSIKFDSLNAKQKHQILNTEIKRRRASKMKEIQDLFFSLENAAFILWRHLIFYLNPSSTPTVSQISPAERRRDETVVLLQQVLYQSSPVVRLKLREACCSELDPVITYLQTIPNTVLPNTELPEICKRIRKCYNK